MPKVSVIIPTYNRADLLPLALQSVLDQNFQDFEAIVVDDGSTDGSVEVVKAFNDARIRYIYQTNAGLSAARNTGIANVGGEYLALLDSDDIFFPWKLNVQVQQLDDNSDLGFVTGGFCYIDLDGKKIAERQPWRSHRPLNLKTLLIGAPIITNAVMVRTELVKRVGGFNPALRRAEDLDLWLRLGALGCSMAWTPSVVCAYRMHSNQMVRDATEQTKVAVKVFEQLYQKANLPEFAVDLRNQAFASTYLSGACREFGAGQVEEGVRSLLHAVNLDPNLLEGDPPNLGSVMIAWAAEPVTKDPAVFMKDLFEKLPQELGVLQPYQIRFSLSASIAASLDALFVNRSDLAQEYLSKSVDSEPAGWKDFALACELVIDNLMNFPVDQQNRLLEGWFEVLPRKLKYIHRLKGKALGRLFMARGFLAQSQGDPQAGAHFLAGISRDPAWLLNSGVLVSLARFGVYKIFSFARSTE